MGEPSSTVFSSTDSQHRCHLFKQPGYLPNHEQRIRMGEYVWCINPYKYERDGKLGIDIIISVQGIEPGTYLLSEFSLQQPGNEKHNFEHAFDCYRNTFFYRRALTIPQRRKENGILSTHYSLYRFLRGTESDEPYEGDEAIRWKSTIPLQWDIQGEAPVWADMNDTFLENIYAIEDYKMTFMYFFTVESAQKSRFVPFRASICWPKASRTARYLNGRSISVDGNWFDRWPTFKKFMDNVDLLTPDDFDDLVDVLGVYYHSWNVDHHRLLELVRAAEKYGFYDFSQTMIIVGNVDVYFSSMRSVLFAPNDHPLMTINNESGSVTKHDEVFAVSQKNVYHEDLCGPPVYKCFKTKNGMAWTVNLHRKTYSKQEYLCVSLMLNGDYRPDENQLWKVEIAPAKHSSLGKLPRREHTRVLNSVQRTICFPTCWLWNDVVKEMGQNGPYTFSLKTSFRSLSGWKFDEVAGNEAATGMNNAELQCKDGVIIAVNKEFLQSACRTMREWQPMKDKPKRMELKDLEFNETVHFLDHLYHVSKLYTTEIWTKVLKVAQVTNCDPVVDQFERALIRTETRKMNDKKISENYSLEFLKFNVEMRAELGIEPLDDFLATHPEPTIKCFDN